MKILHVNSLLQHGGAETVMRQLLRNFPEASVAISSAKTYPPGVHPLYPRLLARLYHSRFHALVERFAPRNQWTDRAFRRLVNYPCDLIHLHNFHGYYATIDSLAAVARAKPLVWTFHALWGITGGCDHPRDCRRYFEACGECPQLNKWPLGPIDNTPQQLAAKKAQLSPLPLHVISPSRWMAQVIRESPVGRRWRVHCIPNAVDAEFLRIADARFASRRETNRLRILLVNRNFGDEQKGFSIAREALREFAAAAGESPEKRPKLTLAGVRSEWAAGELPEWECEALGYISEPTALAEIYSQADLFLFASPAENFPCVVLEAMAAGACVVATPTGGVVEQIEHGVSGLLARDISGPALAEALARACQNSDERKALAAAARDRVQREFSEPVFAEQHRELYQGILSEWPSDPK